MVRNLQRIRRAEIDLAITTENILLEITSLGLGGETGTFIEPQQCRNIIGNNGYEGAFPYCSDIARWRDKKESERANAAYNEVLYFGLENMPDEDD